MVCGFPYKALLALLQKETVPSAVTSTPSHVCYQVIYFNSKSSVARNIGVLYDTDIHVNGTHALAVCKAGLKH